jgi:hypothetical protein
VGPLGSMEPTLKYHPEKSESLTVTSKPGPGQWLVGSLTGAVTSERVTEARKGSLRLIGNQPKSVKA